MALLFEVKNVLSRLQKSKLFEEVKSYQKVTFLESPFGRLNCAGEEAPLKGHLIRRENSLEVRLTGGKDSLVRFSSKDSSVVTSKVALVKRALD